MKSFISLIILLSLSLLAAQCSPAASQEGTVTASDISARITTENGAVYMTLKNDTQSDDALLGGQTDIARAVELHESKMAENEVMQMQPVANIPVPAGGSVALQPGGLHMMLIDIQKELGPGDKFNLTLNFEKAGAMTVEAEVMEGSMSHNMGEEQAD